MHSDDHLNDTCVIRQRGQQQFSVCRVQNTALGCLLSVCLLSACITPEKSPYLTTAEIQESIVGNSVKVAEPDDWKDEFIPFADNRREGMIRGHSPEGPYSGAWSIVGDSMCLEYPGDPEYDRCYQLSRDNGSTILWFYEAGELAFEAELIERSKAEAITVESVFPDFRKETITFQNGDNSLVGDLSLPEGPAPFPAVVFVFGSGPQSRHGWKHWPGRTIPDEFLRRGFATFIWSRSGVDESTGSWVKQTMTQRAEEVAAAMTHLAERPDIDGNRIGLWGGSQAGWVMPMVPTHRSVAFVIAVGCPSRTGMEQTMYVADNELASAGISEQDRLDALEHIRALFGMVQTEVDFRRYEEWLTEVKLRPWYPEVERKLGEVMLLELLFSKIDSEWFEYLSTFYANDAPPQLENLDMPLLAIWGANDVIVDPSLGVKAYEEIPRLNGNPDVTTKVFGGAGHALMSVDEEDYLEFPPGYISMMGEWLAEHR